MPPEPLPFRSGRIVPAPFERSPFERIFVVSTLLTLAWGTFAFGAVYPWAYRSLSLLCLATGVAGLAFGRRRLTPHAWLFGCLFLVGAVGLLQIVPLSQGTLAAISPGTDQFLRMFDLRYAIDRRPGPDDELVAVSVRHGISIAPWLTLRALGLLAAFMLFLAGLLRAVSRDMALRLARGLVWIGVALSLFGIVQKAILGDDPFLGMKIYGFWTPRYLLTTPFGPFVNKNHFAGWMLMVIPLALGLAMGAIERHAMAMGRGLRRRIVWLSGPEGGKVGLVLFAALLMTLALVMTRSRSGLACLVAMLMMLALTATRHVESRRGRVVVMVSLALFLMLPLFWAGRDTAVGRFVTESGSVQLRLNIWRAALTSVRDFPLFGSGLDTFGTVMLRYQPEGQALRFQEAHNDYLQLLVEGGFLLWLVLAFCVTALVHGIYLRFRAEQDRRENYWIRVGATIGLIAVALQSAVEFSLQMPGNAALFVLLMALALHSPARDR